MLAPIRRTLNTALSLLSKIGTHGIHSFIHSCPNTFAHYRKSHILDENVVHYVRRTCSIQGKLLGGKHDLSIKKSILK